MRGYVRMVVGELFEQAVTVEKTVWQKRGDKIVRKDIARLLATVAESKTTTKRAAVNGR
jgi:hypothetical protein